MIERSKRGVTALILVGGALAACHGERPDVVAQPADAGAPGLLVAKSASAKLPIPDAAPPIDASAPLDASAPASIAEPAVAPRASAEGIPAASLSAAVSANNAFAVALYARVRAGNVKTNLLTSPISAELALSMAYAGATGQTRSEMARALQFGATPAKTLFEGQNALSQALQSRAAAAFALAGNNFRGSAGPALASDYEFQIVNSIWGEASYTWEAPFLQTLATDYGASVYKRDFRTQWDPARLAINAWVSKQTSDKINDLLPRESVTKDTRMVLVNALHLKLPWQSPFYKGATAVAPFTRVDKTQVSTPFMNDQGQLAYADDGAAQVVSLPLFGNQLAVVIALPHAGSSLEAYERSLRVGSLLPPHKSALVKLSLPKSAFTSPTFSLADALKALGMTQAFDEDKAHFEGMCAHPPRGEHLFVSDVLQKTMIDVQETGVEAAAATAVLMATTAAAIVRRPEPVPVPMIVNRPYLIAVVDVPTGAILMLGHITDPSSAPSH